MDKKINTQQKNKKNFIVQAGVLAAAGIVVRLIGILYRTPLVMIIGDEGNGYYNTAYNIYTIILLVSSYSIPSAISKVIAAKLGMKEYRNAYRLFMGSIIYVLIVGGLASGVCFFCAPMLVGASSARVLRVFAPTVFFSGFLGCLRGFFQAHHTMVFTSISQILEQIANAAVSIGMAYALTSSLIGKGADESSVAIGGAIGSAVGTGAGVLVALGFMYLVYRVNRDYIHKRMERDFTPVMSGIEIAKSIVGMVTPVVLSTFIYNLNTAANLKIYQHMMIEGKGMAEAIATTNYGLFSGKSMQIVNIPIALAAAMSSAIIPAIARTHERGEYEEGRRKMAMAIKVTMLIAIPAAFGLCVFAKPITMLLYPQRASVDMVASMIRVLSITVVFYCLSTLSNAILQGTGYVRKPVVNAAVAFAIQVSVLILLLKFTNLGLYSLCIATITYSLLMCILNGISMYRNNGFRHDFKKEFLLPGAAALGMTLVSVITYALTVYIIRLIVRDPSAEISGMKNVVLLIIGVGMSAVTYAVLILKLGVATRQELRAMPKGSVIVRIGEKLHLFPNK
ncbi:MAG: polysaccharide biosynthesis protein [Lachnospiraceae bacterium]|nr:polysaccharide biosynthesis protein [Lachnospiraceae bacterium]